MHFRSLSRHPFVGALAVCVLGMSLSCQKSQLPEQAPTEQVLVPSVGEVLEGPWFISEQSGVPVRCIWAPPVPGDPGTRQPDRCDDCGVICEQGDGGEGPLGRLMRAEFEPSNWVELEVNAEGVWVGSELVARLEEGELVGEQSPGALFHGPLYNAINEAVQLRVRVALLEGEEPNKAARMRVRGDVGSRVVLQVMYTALQAGVERMGFGIVRELGRLDVECQSSEGNSPSFPMRWVCEPDSEGRALSFAEYDWVDVFTPSLTQTSEGEREPSIPTQTLQVMVGVDGFRVLHNGEVLSQLHGCAEPGPTVCLAGDEFDYWRLYETLRGLADAHENHFFEVVILPEPGVAAQSFLKTFDVVSNRLEGGPYDSMEAFEVALRSAGPRSRLFERVLVGVVQ